MIGRARDPTSPLHLVRKAEDSTTMLLAGSYVYARSAPDHCESPVRKHQNVTQRAPEFLAPRRIIVVLTSA